MTTNTTTELIETLEKVTGATTEGNVAVLANGEEVRVFVCDTQTLPHLLRFVGRVSQDLGLTLSNTNAITEQLLMKVDDVGFLLQLIANYSDDLYKLIVRLTDIPSLEVLLHYPVDDMLTILTRVANVNRDFFTERVLPVFLRAIKADL